MRVWLDDTRDPRLFGRAGLVWVKTAVETINLLNYETVTFLSLDHDLSPQQYDIHSRDLDDSDYKIDTGLAVIQWMKKNNIIPRDGLEIHTGNTIKRLEMVNLARTFIPDDKVFVKIYQRSVN